jgi:hypothetical protein
MRRSLTKKSARCAPTTLACQQSKKRKANKKRSRAVILSVKRQNEYQGYRSGPPERTVTISSMPVLLGAAMIAAAILLSTLLSAIGTRYRCEAPGRGKASCDNEIATGSIPERPKSRGDGGTP